MFTVLSIDRRIQNCRHLLILAHKHPYYDKDAQDRNVKQLTQMFKRLLAQKSREEAIQNICNNYGSNTEDTRAGKTDDPRPRICIRDILKKKIARCG